MDITKALLTIIAGFCVFIIGCGIPTPREITVEFSRECFATLVNTLSEDGGYFDSDNIVSNEAGYLHVKNGLEYFGVQGGVYIGVGPDQNFTYIAQIKPRYAFILDIRRDNLIEHLVYKAIFALAETRAEFLSLLFSKPLSALLLKTDNPSMLEMIAYFDRTPGRLELYRSNLKRIQKKLQTYGIGLTNEDHLRVTELYQAFYDRHLDLRWEYRSDGSRGISFITYRSFLLGRDLEGSLGNFLNNDEDYQFIKGMQARNGIIPITGDFAGNHSLKSIGSYVRARGDRISAFYLSNVEYYLHPDDLMDEFAENIRHLPTDNRSMLIRAFVNVGNETHPKQVDRQLMTTILQYTRSFSQLFADGAYRSYIDLGVKDYMQ